MRGKVAGVRLATAQELPAGGRVKQEGSMGICRWLAGVPAVILFCAPAGALEYTWNDVNISFINRVSVGAAMRDHICSICPKLKLPQVVTRYGSHFQRQPPAGCARTPCSARKRARPASRRG